MTGLQIIEEVYGLALNPQLPYAIQLEPLAASGELASRIHANTVLFKLCELVDAQGREIKQMKDAAKSIVHVNVTDPTKPITNTTV